MPQMARVPDLHACRHRLRFHTTPANVVQMAAAIEAEATMGDKSPKSKDRSLKQKNAARAEDAAAAKAKQANQSQTQQPPAKGRK